MSDPVFRDPSPIAKVFYRVRYRPWFWRGDFTSDWIWKNYSIWRRVLAPLRDRPAKILEIDSFEGTAEEGYVYKLLENHLPGIEARFNRNLAPFSDRVEKIKSRSAPALDFLIAQGRQFDLAYIDGGHRYEDVMGDSTSVWKMLAPDGIVIWDDYEWAPEFRPDERPQAAVDDFLAAQEGRYRLLAKG